MKATHKDDDFINSEAIRLTDEMSEEISRAVAAFKPEYSAGKDLYRTLHHEMKKCFEFELTGRLLGKTTLSSLARERGRPLEAMFGIWVHVADSKIPDLWNRMRPERLVGYTKIAREWQGDTSALQLVRQMQEFESNGPLYHHIDRISVIVRFISMWARGEIFPLTGDGPLSVSEYTPEMEARNNFMQRILERECFWVQMHGKDVCPSCDRLDWYR